MTEQTSSADPAGPARQRLDSWKDIAAYLKRDVSTVQRWEKREGMPVHRHLHDKLGSVYAFTAELDEWARSRRIRDDEPAALPLPAVDGAEEKRLSPIRSGVWILAAALVIIALTLLWIVNRGSEPRQNPLSSAEFIRLTDFLGIEHAAALSPDGRFMAFISDRDGRNDVWVTQVGTGEFHNLTKGRFSELVNPDIRLLGFSPDGALVTMWTREQKPAGAPDIGIWSVPTLGGQPRLYLEGVAEFEWSSDGRRLVYHTPEPGDPMFVREQGGAPDRRIFVAPAGIHNHYPTWSTDDQFIYFVRGPVTGEQDVWRVSAGGGTPERMTSHKTQVSHLTFLDARTLLYLATDPDGGGPWLYAIDPVTRETRRVSFGLERYTSLARSADARRLVATVANPRRTLWRVPIGAGALDESAATPVSVPIVGGRSPRVGPGYLLYVSSRTSAEGIWKVAGGNASELWSVAGGRIVGGPAISPDGQKIAFAADSEGKTRLYVMNADGSGLRTFPESVRPRGAPAWSRDGKSLALAAELDGAQKLAMVSIVNHQIVPLGSQFGAEPVFAADGTVVFSGLEVGTMFPIRSIGPDGRIRPQLEISLARGTRRLAFLPGQNSLVVLQGDMVHKNFFLLDLDTGRQRQLTNFGSSFVVTDFDVSPDGREIVFDREQNDSDIVLIERPGR